MNQRYYLRRIMEMVSEILDILRPEEAGEEAETETEEENDGDTDD